jgi:hypothetical protein
MRSPIIAAALLALVAGGCSTTSDETAGQETSVFEQDTTPVSDSSGGDIETPELASSGPPAAPTEVAASEPPEPKKLSGDPEVSMRESFAAGGLEALPVLDDALSTNPGQLAPLMRGAFAGVGNDTDQCEEILLYLTVRHGHLAGELSSTAAEINPEIQSWTQ